MATPVDFLSVLKENRQFLWPYIEKQLDSFFIYPAHCQIPSKYQSLLDFHRQMVEDYPRRLGKYVRPTLVFLTAQSLGAKKDFALNTAAAMQLSEDWILNHDDIEDDSEVRRGQPALHRLYGKELAINAGDGLHLLMWQTLISNLSTIGPDLSQKIFTEFTQMLNRTVLGQTIEIKWFQENRTDLTDEDLLLIMESKTCYYTISGPMRLGAILAGATKDQLDHLYQFGKYLGYCFQIQDDLLDLTSDFCGQKKQYGNDIYEGKRTMMLLHLYQHAKTMILKK